MAKLLKLRRGSTSQHSSFTGAEGEVTIDTTKDTAVVHDGAQAGGRPLAREDMSNVSSASIAGQLGTDSIATTKIAGGALPTDVTVASANIVDGTIVNADVNASAAIAGTKISPDFGSQNVVTTGTLGSGNITISNNAPSLFFTEGDANPDYQLLSNGGQFRIYDVTNTTNRIVVNTDGHVDVTGNLDVGAGVDVTGNITTTSGNLTVDGIGSVEDTFKITDSAGTQYLLMGNQDSAGANSPRVFSVGNASLNIGVGDSWSSNTGGTLTNHFGIAKNGTITSYGNHDFSAGVDVTGNITVTGTVDGRDVAADGSKLDNYQPNGSSYLRSDANDTATGDLQLDGQINFNNTGTNPVVIGNASGDNPRKLLIRGADSPFIQFRENNTDKAYLQWHSDGFFRIGNEEDSSQLRIQDDIKFSQDGSTFYKVWHEGNDGSGSGLHADLLDGVQGSSYLRSDADDTATRRIVFSNNETDNDDTMASTSGNLGGIEIYNSGVGNDAFMAFHAGSDFAMYFGLDADTNDLAVGGWSMGANKYKVWHAGNDGAGSGLDADTLDGISSADFLRADTADTAAGDISFGGGAGAITINANSDIRMSSGSWTGDYGAKIQHHENHLYVQYGSGNFYIRNPSGNNRITVDQSGNLTATGNVTAYSDARLKTNVNTINDALSIVGKLRGVSFDWKETGKRSIGVIAQEVEEVLPEVVVTTNDPDPNTGKETEIKSVDYGKMVGVLINAINELKAEVDELKGGK